MSISHYIHIGFVYDKTIEAKQNTVRLESSQRTWRQLRRAELLRVDNALNARRSQNSYVNGATHCCRFKQRFCALSKLEQLEEHGIVTFGGMQSVIGLFVATTISNTDVFFSHDLGFLCHDSRAFQSASRSVTSTQASERSKKRQFSDLAELRRAVCRGV